MVGTTGASTSHSTMVDFGETRCVDRDALTAYALSEPGAEETYPWGEEELVARVGGKGFAFIGPAVAALPKGRRPGN